MDARPPVPPFDREGAVQDAGYMQRRFASINDLPIGEAQRRFRWPLGPRPDEHPSLSDLGL